MHMATVLVLLAKKRMCYACDTFVLIAVYYLILTLYFDSLISTCINDFVGRGGKEGGTYTTIGYIYQSGTKIQNYGQHTNKGKVFRTCQVSCRIQTIQCLA